MAMWQANTWESMPEETDDLLSPKSANQTPSTHGKGHLRMLAAAAG
eukprot:CAMPEP_0172686876 /NCGR_PEP_ID=MMETSP1074-20121228/21252_1 /TAXON_ID=2916 /ORGANISM="Ceratium fusus, Strain PA161109" /LENGTH=45 /DNA_ID= /DNA_START= /DNA_END= /DNA_ORIENTATION=